MTKPRRGPQPVYTQVKRADFDACISCGGPFGAYFVRGTCNPTCYRRAVRDRGKVRTYMRAYRIRPDVAARRRVWEAANRERRNAADRERYRLRVGRHAEAA